MKNQDKFELAIKEIARKKIKNNAELEKIKKVIAQKLKIANPSNSKLLEAYHNLTANKSLRPNRILEHLLVKRKIRSLSGIVVVSVLTKPYSCPGKCIYCPTQKGIPKSYLDKEPAVMRAILNKFDPYLQIKSRIKALEANGHPTDKVDLRIIGGTWSYYPKKYQTWFIKRCFEAANSCKSKSLKASQDKNEKSFHRIIGITIETRPDFIDEKEIRNLRELGVTRIELGIQSIYDDILELNKRGHYVKETTEAAKLLKNAGFKICFQMMPNLPGANFKRDKKMFEELFNNQNYRPDMLKIYPCHILKEAPVYKLIKKLKYKPYTEKELKNLIKFIKKTVPYYVRIQRIIRDIPAYKIALGLNNISNLRQVISKEITEEGWKCKCIRCREVRDNYKSKDKLYLFRQNYNSSGSKEIFLSYETKNRNKLYSLLRLRISNSTIFPALKNAAIIREVHTYGHLHPITSGGQTPASSIKSPQHKGLGKKLMKEAERIAKKEFGIKKIAVISGIGVRGYYKKLGYRLKDTYMVKII